MRWDKEGVSILSASPLLIVIAGVNGAGKSTITDRLRQEYGDGTIVYTNPQAIAFTRAFRNYINPDDIALTLNNIV
jgi:predicted ABC-type ATPase